MIKQVINIENIAENGYNQKTIRKSISIQFLQKGRRLMTMKKRLISLVLCTCMLIVGLVGCGKSKKDDTETQEGTYSATEIIMGDTSHESENEMYDTELEFETESEEPVPENVVYSISTYTVNSWTQEFLKLYLGCHVNYYLGNVKVEPVNITTMRKHSNIVGMLTVAEGMRVKSDYSDNLFNLKNSNLYYRIHTNNTGSKNNINYRVSVSLLESNFDTFRYYQGTDAGLGLVHKVTFFIDDNEIKENYYFVSAWVNNAGKPEEWLMESGIFISETEYKKVQGQAFDKMLINEDDEKEKE